MLFLLLIRYILVGKFRAKPVKGTQLRILFFHLPLSEKVRYLPVGEAEGRSRPVLAEHAGATIYRNHLVGVATQGNLVSDLNHQSSTE